MKLSLLIVACIGMLMRLTKAVISGNVYVPETTDGITFHWYAGDPIIRMIEYEVEKIKNIDYPTDTFGVILEDELNGWYIVYGTNVIRLEGGDHVDPGKYYDYDATTGYEAIFDQRLNVKFCRYPGCVDVPSTYTTVEYKDDILCGLPATTDIRADQYVMDIYKFESSGSYDEVILEACDSKHDTWLYLFGADGTKIYDIDDQVGCGNQGDCQFFGFPGSQYSGDITVTDAVRVNAKYPGYTSIEYNNEYCNGNSNCPSPDAIKVNDGDVYFFGIGSYQTASPADCYSTNDCEYTIELLCGTNCLSSAKNEFRFDNKYGAKEPEQFVWRISYNSLYLLIAGILILLLVINIYCMIKRNNSSFNKKYKKVVTFSDSDIDAESQQLK